MTVVNLKNVAASIRQRLLNKAKSENRPFNELLQYYMMERFLYRLGISPYIDKFILKGALMLRVWGASRWRPTMDIDMLGKTGNRKEEILEKIKYICSVKSDFPDGLIFDIENMSIEDITADAEYPGVRVMIPTKLDTAVLKIQLDIGFGDAVYPEPQKCFLPVLLDLPAPNLLCYSRESCIAEKFETMLKLGKLNSRMKDFYDIWLLASQFNFKGADLRDSVDRTFRKREVEIPENAIVFSEEFAEAKKIQWNSFRKKLRQSDVPENFNDVISIIKKFLNPVTENLISGKSMPKTWRAPNNWE